MLKLYCYEESLGKFPELFWRLIHEQNQLVDVFYLFN